MVVNLSGNSISRVWTDGKYHWKEQPKYLCDNEWYALSVLKKTGYVPYATRVSNEIVQMATITNEEITDEILFRDMCFVFLRTLEGRQLRHGDLTSPHIFVVQNSPVVIDWGESRMWNDPRPDKRREGDRHWLERSIEKIISVQRALRLDVETD